MKSKQHNKTTINLAVIGLIFGAAGIGSATAQGPVQAVKPVMATRTALGISYPEGSTVSVKFVGTDRLPKGSGEAKVERKKGTSEIEIELDEMKPAAMFGGDYATYVLWIASPEGIVDNAGEFILQGNRSKLDVSTTLETFGMFITAEPHFLVETPSRFVVLESTLPKGSLSGGELKTSRIEYRGNEGQYAFERPSLDGVPESKGETRSEVQQARVAVKLAEQAGAATYASAELAQARASLDKTMAALEAGMSKPQLLVPAHETVRLAVDAKKRAETNAFQAALDSERKQHSDEIARMNSAVASAQTEAERARLEAQRREMDLRMEQQARDQAAEQARAAAQRADEEARRAAEEARKREAAEQQAQQAQQQAQQAQQQAQQLASAKQQAEAARLQAEQQAQQANSDAAQARQAAEQARQRMHDALGKVAETRQTARGLIVNLPDILFDFNKASLKTDARERLSKVCGILLVAPGYDLSIEGHTDSVGSDSYNQELSEHRAQSVAQYLRECGLNGQISSTKGFGETQPIASNTTAAGREKNRRVEIVIHDSQAQVSE